MECSTLKDQPGPNRVLNINLVSTDFTTLFFQRVWYSELYTYPCFVTKISNILISVTSAKVYVT